MAEQLTEGGAKNAWQEAVIDNLPPLEALAARLQGCLYRADMLQKECDALLVDFPEQEKALRELSAWIAGAVR